MGGCEDGRMGGWEDSMARHAANLNETRDAKSVTRQLGTRSRENVGA